ncbi:MAG: lipopolysaccharide biosynthesis protein [Lachnospiraceae bacterium]
MKREKSQLKAGIVLSYINVVIGNLIPLFYTPIMLSLLGQNQYGLYKLASSISSYMSLLAFGMGGAVTRYLIKANSEGGKEAEENMLGMFHIIFQVIAVVTLLVGGIVTCNLGIIYSGSLTTGELSEMKVLVAILVVNTAVGFSASAYNAVVSSHERFMFLQGINVITTIVTPIANLIVLYLGYSSLGMVLASLVLNILVRIMYIIYVRYSLEIRPRYNNLPLSLLKELLTFSFWIFVANIVSQLYNSTDTMIIGAIPSLATVGVAIYNVGATFNNIVFSLAQAVSGLFIPKANKMVFAGASSEELTDYVISVGRYQCFVITLVCSGFVAFGRPFINFYVGNDYADAYWIAIVMMIPSCIPLVQSVANSITQAKNMHRFRSLTYLFIAILNVVGTYVLVHSSGIIGAAVMTGLANIVGQGFLMNWYYWKKVGLNIPRFWKNILSIEWIPLLLCVIFLIVGKVINFYAISAFLGGIVVYIILYIILIWKFSLNEDEKKVIMGFIYKIKNISGR